MAASQSPTKAKNKQKQESSSRNNIRRSAASIITSGPINSKKSQQHQHLPAKQLALSNVLSEISGFRNESEALKYSFLTALVSVREVCASSTTTKQVNNWKGEAKIYNS